MYIDITIVNYFDTIRSIGWDYLSTLYYSTDVWYYIEKIDQGSWLNIELFFRVYFMDLHVGNIKNIR